MERNEKYLDFLKEIHTALKYTDKINMSDFNKRHNVSKIVYQTMVQGGIIKSNGMRSKGCRYYWISPIEPNMAMSNELIKRIRLANKEYNATRKQKKSPQQTIFNDKVASKEPKEPKESKSIPQSRPSKKISVMWGLLSIEY